MTRFLLLATLAFTLFPHDTWSEKNRPEDLVPLAAGKRLGVEIFAERINGGWCRPELVLVFRSENEDYLESRKLRQVLGRARNKLNGWCREATRAVVRGETLDGSEVRFVGKASKSELWKPVLEGSTPESIEASHEYVNRHRPFLEKSRRERCHLAAEWSRKLKREYPEVDFEKGAFRAVRPVLPNLLADPDFVPVFGKPYDDLDASEHDRLYRETGIVCNSTGVPKESSQEFLASAARYAVEVAFRDAPPRGPNGVGFGVSVFGPIVERDRQRRKWASEQIAGLGGEQTMASLNALLENAEAELGPLWPSEQEAFREAVLARRTEVAQRHAQTLIAEIHGLGTSREDARSINALLKRDDAVLEAIPAAERLELLAEAHGKRDAIVSPLIDEDLRGLSDLPATLEGLATSAQRIREIEEEYAGLLSGPQRSKMAEAKRRERERIASGALPEFRAALADLPETPEGERAAHTLLAETLAFPIDRQSPTYTSYHSATATRSKEIQQTIASARVRRRPAPRATPAAEAPEVSVAALLGRWRLRPSDGNAMLELAGAQEIEFRRDAMVVADNPIPVEYEMKSDGVLVRPQGQIQGQLIRFPSAHTIRMEAAMGEGAVYRRCSSENLLLGRWTVDTQTSHPGATVPFEQMSVLEFRPEEMRIELRNGTTPPAVPTTYQVDCDVVTITNVTLGETHRYTLLAEDRAELHFPDKPTWHLYINRVPRDG